MNSPRDRASACLGFTLVELVVVVVIIGILAAIFTARGGRVLETQRAISAAGKIKIIGAANRMHKLEKGRFVLHAPGAQALHTAADCQGAVCGPCNQYGICPPCNLIACGFLHDDLDDYWDLVSCDPEFPVAMAPCGITSVPANTIIACGRWNSIWKEKASAGAKDWMYAVDLKGDVIPVNDAPAP